MHIFTGFGPLRTPDVSVWLQKYSKEAITIDSFSIQLADINGTMQEICSKTGLSFPENQSYLNIGIPDARFAMPKIFYDGKLQIRCHLRIKSNEKAEENSVDNLL